MTELESASVGVWQCPAVITVSASTSVTEHVESWRIPVKSLASTVTIIPTLRATRARTSAAEGTQATFSHCGGFAQYQNGSYVGSVYEAPWMNGSQLEMLGWVFSPACDSPRPYSTICAPPPLPPSRM